MTGFIEDADRQVIPRWRDFEVTKLTGQLRPLASPVNIKSQPEIYITERKSDWEKNHDIPHACDLLSAAVAAGDHKIIGAIDKFLSAQNNAPRLALTIAKEILNNESTTSLPSPNDTNEKTLSQRIHTLRGRLTSYPRNAIGWTDLARAYTMLGQRDKAVRAIEIARALSPNNRFVLRSAVRLFVHQDNLDRARHVLKISTATPHDPWLLAADIAVARAAKMSSPLIKKGKNILDGQKFKPWHLTELAAAIGTSEFMEGRNRKAQKLFKLALRNPTENTIAQAGWAARHQLSVTLDCRLTGVFGTFEACAWDNYVHGNWQKTMNEAWNWLYDQPFSSRPAILGSYVSAVALGEYEESANIARTALRCNPQHFLLRNNLVFALAHMGQVAEAVTEFQKIYLPSLNPGEKAIALATLGLLNYRSGDFKEGFSHYSRALEIAKGFDDTRLHGLAAIFFALEENRCGGSKAAQLRELALKITDSQSDTSINRLRNHVRKPESVPKENNHVLLEPQGHLSKPLCLPWGKEK